MMSGGFDIPLVIVPLFNKETCLSKPEFKDLGKENEIIGDSDAYALTRAKTCALDLEGINKGKSFKVIDTLNESGNHVYKVVEGEGDTIRFDGYFSLNGSTAREIADTLTRNSNVEFKAVKYETNWLHSSYWFVAVDSRWVRAQAQK